ncbi:MAG: sigma-54-dependent transcriptional regulator [bacterium]|jgi:two-component system response regulator AtoC
MAILRRGTVLVVDDERGMCHILRRLLSDQGYTVYTALNAAGALEIIDTEDIDAALIDIRMPGMDGLDLLNRMSEVSADTSVVMMTAYGTIETAVKAMKRGAYDYITKPFNNDEVLHIIGNAIERKRLIDRNRYLTEALGEVEGLEGMVGNSRPMQELYRLIERVAPTDSTVLILGESGTGKELVARALHARSTRRDEKCIAINCGALPRELIESELFGHEKGAFSGAHQRKMGLIESANAGTLFLDEIGDLPMDLQVKILRVIEQKEVRRIGSLESKSVDVRIIAATNRDLRDDIQEGKFREDLFYRLSILELHLPPLRTRKEDIPQLVDYFISRFNQKMNRAITGISPEALRILMDYHYPGNVRELENVIQRAMVLRDQGVIELSDLPANLSAVQQLPATAFIDPSQLSFQKAREAFEHRYLEQLLKINNSNVTQSATMAGMSRRHLQELMKKYNLRSSDQ